MLLVTPALSVFEVGRIVVIVVVGLVAVVIVVVVVVDVDVDEDVVAADDEVETLVASLDECTAATEVADDSTK